MRDVKPRDLILHLTDNEGFTGVSSAVSSVADFNGVAGTEWGEGPSYNVPLRDFRKLQPPLSRDTFFASPFKEERNHGVSANARAITTDVIRASITAICHARALRMDIIGPAPARSHTITAPS